MIDWTFSKLIGEHNVRNCEHLHNVLWIAWPAFVQPDPFISHMIGECGTPSNCQFISGIRPAFPIHVLRCAVQAVAIIE